MNFFDHKDLGNHLLQLSPKVVKHPVYIYTHTHTHTHTPKLYTHFPSPSKAIFHYNKYSQTIQRRRLFAAICGWIWRAMLNPNTVQQATPYSDFHRREVGLPLHHRLVMLLRNQSKFNITNNYSTHSIPTQYDRPYQCRETKKKYTNWQHKTVCRDTTTEVWAIINCDTVCLGHGVNKD